MKIIGHGIAGFQNRGLAAFFSDIASLKFRKKSARERGRTNEMRKQVCGNPSFVVLMGLLGAAVLGFSEFDAQTAVVLTTLYSFDGGTNGISPNGLVQTSDGNFYGTTPYTVFRFTINGHLTTLHSFASGDFGAGLVQGIDGNLYGATWGLTPGGSLFEISTNGTFVRLHTFGDYDAHPTSELVDSRDGDLYGTTQGSGQFGVGTFFKISSSGQLTTLYSFGAITNATGSALDGAVPHGVIQGCDGDFYGATGAGGLNTNAVGSGLGTVFKITTNGVLTTLYSFSGEDGIDPRIEVQGSDGILYGITAGGGMYGGGTVFKITTNGVLTSLHSFSGQDGDLPGGLVQGSDDNFYGTTFQGGLYVDPNGYGCGTVFKISPDGQFDVLHFFALDDGLWPGIIRGSDGSFYGTTSGGGPNEDGTIFRLSFEQTAPVFQTITLTDTSLNLTWSTEAGQSYQLQYNSDLNSTNWTNLWGPLSATGTTLSSMDFLTNATSRFYRVVRLF